jgi:hypothetical protein
MEKNDLIMDAINQIEIDLKMGDTTAIEELLASTPTVNLEAFLEDL